MIEWKKGQDSSFIYELNANGTNKWFCQVQPGFDDFGERTNQSALEDIANKMQAANDMYKALDEAVKDLVGARNSAYHAAKTDNRWKGVSEILSNRIDECRKALVKARGERV